MTTYACTTCKRRLGESDVIIADVRSDVGWRRPDGTVDYPMITKKYCWKHVPSSERSSEGSGSFRNAERATYAPPRRVDRTPDPDRAPDAEGSGCVYDGDERGGWCTVHTAVYHDRD